MPITVQRMGVSSAPTYWRVNLPSLEIITRSPLPAPTVSTAISGSAAFAGERERRGDGLARWSRDRERQISFAAEAQRGHARPVLHEQRGIELAAHVGHVADVVRVNNARVAEAMLGLLRLGDAFLH